MARGNAEALAGTPRLAAAGVQFVVRTSPQAAVGASAGTAASSDRAEFSLRAK